MGEVQDKVFHRPSEVHDAEYLACYIREIDKQECAAMSPDDTILDSLLKSYFISEECNTIIANREPIGMFGVFRESDTTGVVWMLGSEKIKDVSFSFLKKSRKWVESKMDEYETLHNWVGSDNEVSINWLGFLGFEFGQQARQGGMTFVHFERNRKCAKQS